MTPREEVSTAFAAQLEVGLGFEVERNHSEPADLDAREEYIVVLDGPEEPEEMDEQTGLALHKMQVAVNGYLRGENIADALNDLLTKVRHTAVLDRTLGGKLWGEVEREDQEFSYFNGMLVGGLVEWDAFTTMGASPGGFFSQEFTLVYATDPSNALVLVSMGAR